MFSDFHFRRFIKTATSADMDILIRLKILEGAAKVSPGTWVARSSHQNRLNLEKAQQYFEDELSDEWVTTRDMGLYSSIIQAARKKGATTQEAQDVAQDVVAGLSIRAPGGALYYIGDRLSGFISSGSGFRQAVSLVLRHAGQRASDIVRKRRKEVQEVISPYEEGEVPLKYSDLPARSQLSILLEALSDRSYAGRKIRGLLRKIWETSPRVTERDFEIIKPLLDNPAKFRSWRDLAKYHGVSEPRISKVKQKLVSVAREAIEDAPKIQNLLDHEIDKLQINLNVRRASQRSIRRVASRWIKKIS